MQVGPNIKFVHADLLRTNFNDYTYADPNVGQKINNTLQHNKMLVQQVTIKHDNS